MRYRKQPDLLESYISEQVFHEFCQLSPIRQAVSYQRQQKRSFHLLPAARRAIQVGSKPSNLSLPEWRLSEIWLGSALLTCCCWECFIRGRHTEIHIYHTGQRRGERGSAGSQAGGCCNMQPNAQSPQQRLWHASFRYLFTQQFAVRSLLPPAPLLPRLPHCLLWHRTVAWGVAHAMAASAAWFTTVNSKYFCDALQSGNAMRHRLTNINANIHAHTHTHRVHLF